MLSSTGRPGPAPGQPPETSGQAIETSKKYGPASYKARLAWEAVEALENAKKGVLQLKQLDEDANNEFSMM